MICVTIWGKVFQTEDTFVKTQKAEKVGIVQRSERRTGMSECRSKVERFEMSQGGRWAPDHTERTLEARRRHLDLALNVIGHY